LNKIKFYAPGITWTLLIFILSSAPASSLHLPQFWDLFSLDKLAHATFYFLLFLLWNYSFIKDSHHLNSKQLFFLLLACVLYGGAIELFQGYCLSGRKADWVDALANTIGAVAGYIYCRKRYINA
jgi:VanZ family protein